VYGLHVVLQNDELIRERYLVEDVLDGKTVLFHSPENDIIHDWLEDRERKPRTSQKHGRQNVTNPSALMALSWMRLSNTRQRSYLTLEETSGLEAAERRSDITNAYLLNLRPQIYAKAKVWTFSLQKDPKLSPSQTCSNAIKNTFNVMNHCGQKAGLSPTQHRQIASLSLSGRRPQRTSPLLTSPTSVTCSKSSHPVLLRRYGYCHCTSR
jgi:hypothetical protein